MVFGLTERARSEEEERECARKPVLRESTAARCAP